MHDNTRDIVNLTTLGVIFTCALALYVGAQSSISGMGPAGIIVNLLGLILIVAATYSGSPQAYLLFFSTSLLIGPFMLFNFGEFGSGAVGRLDYFVALTLGICMIIKRGVISRPLFITVFSVATLFVWGFFLATQADETPFEFLAAWYEILGRLAVAGLIFYLLIVIKRVGKKNCKGAMQYWASLLSLILILVHAISSWLQLGLPINLRSYGEISSLSVAGFAINRPVGLLGGSYVYGVTTFALWWIWNFLCGCGNQRLSRLLLYTLLPVMLIASRSVALGIILFFFLWVWGGLNSLKRGFFALFAFAAVLMVVLNYSTLIKELDQSSSTKVLLMWHTLVTWAQDFPSFITLLGFGHDRASTLAGQIGFFDLAADLGARYDNRIESGSAFLIHNVYIQFLFEYGLLATIAVAWLIWRGLKNIVMHRLDTATALFWCVAVTHYATHNGLFAPILTVVLLIGTFPQLVCDMDRDNRTVHHTPKRRSAVASGA